MDDKYSMPSSSQRHGFSLIEILVASALLSLIGLAFAAMLKNNFFAARKFEAKGEVEDLRHTLRIRVDCPKTLTSFETPSGFPEACHKGKGEVEIRAANDSVVISTPTGVIGNYELRVTCPGPGPENCGCDTGNCLSCGEKLRFEFRHAFRDKERDWKALFSPTLYPCSHLFGGPVFSVHLHPHEFAPPLTSIGLEPGKYDGNLHGCQSSSCVFGCENIKIPGIPEIHTLDQCLIGCTRRDAGAFCAEQGMIFVEMECDDSADSYIAGYNSSNPTYRWELNSHYRSSLPNRAIMRLTCAWGNKEPPTNEME